jgi:uncharacterized protein YbbK (DUF523 family)
LTTPRLPSEQLYCENNAAKVVDIEGGDVTCQFTKGAQIALDIARKYGATRAIPKQNSPSCGNGRTYDGSFSHKIIEGNGVTAELLIHNGIEVISEEELDRLESEV